MTIIMKADLNQIEATIHQLGTLIADSYSEPDNSTHLLEMYSPAKEGDTSEEPIGKNKLVVTKKLELRSLAQKISEKKPTLPKLVKTPALEMNLLPENHTDVAAYEAQLQQIVDQIQDIYLEGPIVDGWLESEPLTPEQGSAMLPSTEVEQLMEEVEDKTTCPSPRASYRLCGIDIAGKMWSRPCPIEQLPSVSMAIARYQKLRQLLSSKQYVETHLRQL